MIQPELFSIVYNKELYRVAFDHRDEKDDATFINIQHIFDGTEQIIPIISYAIGSGNEHLIGSLQYVATKEFVSAKFEKIFGHVIGINLDEESYVNESNEN